MPGILDILGLGRQTPTSKKSDEKTALVPGRAVKATVLGNQPGGLVSVRLLGAEVLAQSRVPLQPGQSLNLRVEETSPQLVLSLMDDEPALGKAKLALALARALSSGQGMAQKAQTILDLDLEKTPAPTPQAAQLMRATQEAVGRMSLDAQKAADPQALKEHLGASGQDLENRLAKAAAGEPLPSAPNLRVLAEALQRELSGHLARLATQDPGQAAALRAFLEAAQGLKGLAEHLSQLNGQLGTRESLFIFSLPLVFADQIRQGELMIGLEGRGGQAGEKDKDGAKLVFMLDMSALGPVLIEARVHPGQAQATFYLDSAEKAAFVGDVLPHLAERLADLGYQAQLSAQVKRRQEMRQETPLKRLIRQEGNYLSITV